MATEQVKYSNAELYVHLHPSFFAYTIYNLSNNQFESIEFIFHDGRNVINNKELSAWLKENQLVFNQAFQKTKLCINSTSFSFLDNKELATVDNFSILNEYNPSTEVLMMDESIGDLVIQFAINKSIYKILTGYFDKEEIHFGDNGILTAIEQFKDKDNYVCCQILNDEASIAVVKNKQLILFNKYIIKNSEDLLYYILLCFQANALDSNKDYLYLFGLIELDSPMHQLIFDYIKNIEIVDSFTELELKTSTNDVSNHYFFNLLNSRS
ncbi:MAG: DUF3822 family protein [Chitinophagales bacterium]